MRLNHRHQLARTVLIATLSLVLPAQDLLARGGGGGGGRGGGGGGGGARAGGGAGGGAARGGGGGGAGGGGARPMNPGASHAGGAGAGGGAAGLNRGGGGVGGGAGAGNRGNEAGIGNRTGIGGAGNQTRGGEKAGIGNQTGGARNTSGIGNNSNNTRGGNVNNGNINAGNTVNVNRNGNNYNHYGNNYGHNGYNNYWHNGYWPGYHPYGYGWGGVATAGLIGWGLGSMASSSGYGGGYSNPYYVNSQATTGTYADYSAPIQAQPQAAAADQNADAPPSPEQAAALKSFDAAREAFKAGNFDAALSKTDEALKQLPSDAALHEFRGLVLFALARYQESASVIYAVLSVGPGWNWTTLSGMYASIDDYTKQLRALEAYGKQHPESPDAAFLLGYHYLTCGYNEQATKQFQIVTKLLPEDKLAPQLLQMVSGNTPGAAPQPPATDAAAANAPQDNDGPPIDKAKLAGTWKASPGKGVAIELTLKDDASFVWKVMQSGKPNLIEGQYSVEGNQLSLVQKSNGEAMVGRVTFADKGGFNFKLVETGPGDPGLNFSK